MKIKEGFFNLFPNTLNENEFSALCALIGQSLRKTKKLKTSFFMDESEYEALFGYGRDRTDQVLTSLENKKFIQRTQKRDKNGKYTINELSITTDFVS